MTTGQILFFSGIALLAISIGLTILFVVKKPQYHPENAAFVMESSGTQRQINGYPTDLLTIRRDSTEIVESKSTQNIMQETEWMKEAASLEETLLLTKRTPADDEMLLLLDEGTVNGSTMLLKETETLTDESKPREITTV